MKLLFKYLFIFSIYAFFIAEAAVAELSPDAYFEMSKKAPEFVQIAVSNVTATSKDEVEHVNFSAIVVSVVKSSTNLQVGDKINICYSINHRPLLGPVQLTRLTRGRLYPAFLKKESKCYQPAVLGYSFSDYLSEQIKAHNLSK